MNDPIDILQERNNEIVDVLIDARKNNLSLHETKKIVEIHNKYLSAIQLLSHFTGKGHIDIAILDIRSTSKGTKKKYVSVNYLRKLSKLNSELITHGGRKKRRQDCFQ